MQWYFDNVKKVVLYLFGYDKVKWVFYVVLFEDLYYVLQQKYMFKGVGVVFIFGVEGGYDVGVNLVFKVDLFFYFVNIGDMCSLIIYLVFIIYCQFSDE